MAKQHARYSPSQLEALEGCLRYRRKPTDDTANEGTLLHEANEKRDLTGLDSDQQSVVTSYWAYLENVKSAHKCSVTHDKELKLEIEDLTFGICDDILVSDDRVDVADLKSGRKAVSTAENNFQCQAYIAGAMLKYPGRKEYWGHMVSPRVPATSSYCYTALDYERIKQRIVALYERLDDPFNPPTPHEELCAMCQRANRCPALSATAVSVAKGIGLPLPDTFAPDALVSPTDRARAQIIATALENWAEQVKENNKKFGEQGGVMDGFVYKERSSGERIDKDATASVVAALREAGYAPDDALFGAMKISLPDLAEIGMMLRGSSEATERGTLRQILGDYIRSSSYKFWQRVDKKKFPDSALLLGQ